MRYQNPQLLYFLFAIAIPILIHLFNFRKHKTIYFSSIRFLKEIKEENKKKSNLKNLLILASRILAITFLVLAFAKPFIPLNTQNKAENIFLYIDNSHSMDVDYGNGNLLEIAKNKAKEIVKAYPSESDFYLITNEFSSNHNSSFTAELMQNQIEKINTAISSKSISEIISKSQTIATANSHLYFISDLQENTLNLENLTEIDSNIQLYVLPIESSIERNISIDSCYINTPIFTSNNDIELNVIISNTSNTNITDEVIFLELDNKQKSQQYINLLANESKKIIFNFSTKNTNIINGKIKTNDFPITYDNSLYFSFTKTEKVNIYCINETIENKAINTLFSKDTALFNYSSANATNINYNILKKQDLIVINELEQLSSGLLSELKNFSKSGGSIAVLPPKNPDFDTYNKMLSSLDLNTLTHAESRINLKINKLNLEHPIFKNVFKIKDNKLNYPTANSYYTIQKNRNSTSILTLENNKDFLVSYSKNKGIIYQFLSPINTSVNTFSKHALFVPVLINIATSSILTSSLFNTLGKNDNFISNYKNNSNDIPHLIADKIDIIPTVKTYNSEQIYNTNNQVKTNGIYSLVYSGIIVDKIAFNYNTIESRNSSISTDNLNSFFAKNKLENASIITTNNKALTTTIKEHQNGKEFWKIALLLSLLFFAIEILLIKLIKL
jgi:hypothetical protein